MMNADFEELEQLSTMIGLAFGLFLMFVLGIILLLNRRNMSGWNLPVSYVWFTFSGRINRKTYWLTGIVSLMLIQTSYEFVINATLFGVSTIAPISAAIISIIMMVTVLPFLVFGTWTALAISFKRCHDRNRSAWFLLIALIPFIGAIWLLVELGFLRGTEGPNRFGPEQSDDMAIAGNAKAQPHPSARREKTIPVRDVEEGPSSNLNDQSNREIIAARLGLDFLSPDEPDNSGQNKP